MTRDEIQKRAREVRTEDDVMELVDAATKDLKAELDHWKTSTGHATPEDQYLEIMDAVRPGRIAELEAALELHAPNDPLVNPDDSFLPEAK